MSEKQPVPICQCVEDALEQYFRQLQGTEPSNLYELILTEVERPLLEVVMHQAGSNQSRAARYLGINRNTLRSKLKQHQIK